MNHPAACHPAGVHLTVHRGPPHECPYLPGRSARNEYLVSTDGSSRTYQSLMDNRFRRSGRVIYRPVCTGCRECVPIRIPVSDYSASRSHRRIQRRNSDLEVRIGPPKATAEKHRIFVDYLRSQHDGSMSEEASDFEEFLYRSPIETLEMTYLLEGRIIAVGIVDVCPTALSSVYFYFDPVFARRSLGVFGGICEIEECRRRGLAYWYLGYYIRDCRRMNYKAGFRPYELLGEDGRWVRPATGVNA